MQMSQSRNTSFNGVSGISGGGTSSGSIISRAKAMSHSYPHNQNINNHHHHPGHQAFQSVAATGRSDHSNNSERPAQVITTQTINYQEQQDDHNYNHHNQQQQLQNSNADPFILDCMLRYLWEHGLRVSGQALIQEVCKKTSSASGVVVNNNGNSNERSNNTPWGQQNGNHSSGNNPNAIVSIVRRKKMETCPSSLSSVLNSSQSPHTSNNTGSNGLIIPKNSMFRKKIGNVNGSFNEGDQVNSPVFKSTSSTKGLLSTPLSSPSLLSSQGQVAQSHHHQSNNNLSNSNILAIYNNSAGGREILRRSRYGHLRDLKLEDQLVLHNLPGGNSNGNYSNGSLVDLNSPQVQQVNENLGIPYEQQYHQNHHMQQTNQTHEPHQNHHQNNHMQQNSLQYNQNQIHQLHSFNQQQHPNNHLNQQQNFHSPSLKNSLYHSNVKSSPQSLPYLYSNDEYNNIQPAKKQRALINHQQPTFSTPPPPKATLQPTITSSVTQSKSSNLTDNNRNSPFLKLNSEMINNNFQKKGNFESNSKKVFSFRFSGNNDDRRKKVPSNELTNRNSDRNDRVLKPLENNVNFNTPTDPFKGEEDTASRLLSSLLDDDCFKENHATSQVESNNFNINNNSNALDQLLNEIIDANPHLHEEHINRDISPQLEDQPAAPANDYYSDDFIHLTTTQLYNDNNSNNENHNGLQDSLDRDYPMSDHVIVQNHRGACFTADDDFINEILRDSTIARTTNTNNPRPNNNNNNRNNNASQTPRQNQVSSEMSFSNQRRLPGRPPYAHHHPLNNPNHSNSSSSSSKNASGGIKRKTPPPLDNFLSDLIYK